MRTDTAETVRAYYASHTREGRAPIAGPSSSPRMWIVGTGVEHYLVCWSNMRGVMPVHSTTAIARVRGMGQW